MTSHRETSARPGKRLAAFALTALAALTASTLGLSLAGCGDDADVVVPTAPAASGQALTAAQINAAQTALDAQSAPVDLSSAGSSQIAAGQGALDDQSGLTK